MRLKAGTGGDQYISVLAGCSADDGYLHTFIAEKRGVRHDDVIRFIKQLKKLCPKHEIAIFCDNGSIFTANDVKYTAADLGVTLIYNIPYRPDFNGMENIWAHVKTHYRSRKREHILAGMSWTNKTLVLEALSTVDKATARNCITRAIDCLDDG